MHGLFLVRDVAMPSYNQTLIWQRTPRILKTP
jgi:hypothetical protein